MRVVILEDNLDRQSAMRAAMHDRFPGMPVEFFAAVQPMIDRLDSTGLYDVALLSLDNDLELIPGAAGQLIDPGSGVEFAEWLSQQPAVPPVVVHTTNAPAGDQIVEQLTASGWDVTRVVPYAGESWISEVWRSTVRNLIVSRSPEGSLSTQGVQILLARHRAGHSLKWALQQILVAAAQSISPGAASDCLSMELVSQNGRGLLTGIVGVGPDLLREFAGGTRAAVLKDCQSAIGAGAMSSNYERLERGLSQLLQRQQVKLFQLVLVEPAVGHQAVLALATRGNADGLDSPRGQSIVRESGLLLELALTRDLGSAANPRVQRVQSS